MTLRSKNTIFYSTANAGYAIYSATSLLSIRRHIPDANLCVLSSGLSTYDKKILKKHTIDYRELDLSNMFTKTWDYPIDCYYIFAGPEIFAKMGYEYSIYIDGDVLCTSNPLRGISGVKCFAGVESASYKGEYIGIFGDDWQVINRFWELPENISTKPRIQSGVVYFNNGCMQEYDFLKNAADIYQKCIDRGIPRKGDDSLFSLMQYVLFSDKDMQILPAAYNYVPQFHKKWHYPIDGLVFFHFTLNKPWKFKPYSHNNPNLGLFNTYIRQWRSVYRTTAPKSWLRTVMRDISISNVTSSIIIKKTQVGIGRITGTKKDGLRKK